MNALSSILKKIWARLKFLRQTDVRMSYVYPLSQRGGGGWQKVASISEWMNKQKYKFAHVHVPRTRAPKIAGTKIYSIFSKA